MQQFNLPSAVFAAAVSHHDNSIHTPGASVVSGRGCNISLREGAAIAAAVAYNPGDSVGLGEVQSAINTQEKICFSSIKRLELTLG